MSAVPVWLMADEDRPRRGDGSRNGEVYEMQPLATTEAGVSPDVTDSEAELLERRDTTSPVSRVGDGDREGEEVGKGSLRRGINLPDAIAMVIGGIIGSGIFITPAIILELTGSFGVSMLCWVVGTAIAVCGGLCFVELALVIPRTGGQIVYLLDAFSFKNRNEWTRLLGRLLGFMYAWASIAIIRPTSLCIIVLTCTRYLTRPFYLECDIPDGIVKCLALAIFVLLTIILMRGVKFMAKITTFISSMKVLSVIFIVIVGIAGVIQRGHFPDSFRRPFQGSEITGAGSVGGIALAMYSVLFAYDGWDGIGYTVEEVKTPEKTLPRAMVIGMAIIAVSYILANISFFSVLSNEDIIGTPALALPFGEAVMGEAGLVIFPILVAISTFGTSLLSFYLASRAIFSGAREGLFPEVLCGVHKNWSTPVAAIAFHVCVSTVYLLSGDISSLIEGQAATMWVFFLLCFVAILIMRVTHKEIKRPFKIWWPVPVIMIVVSVFLIVLPLMRGPGWTLAALALTLTGVPVYFLLVMERPWRVRPAALDKFSGSLTVYVNRLIMAKSSR